MNEGVGYVFAKDPSQAVSLFERSLQSCANYLPTVRMMQTLKGEAELGGAKQEKVSSTYGT